MNSLRPLSSVLRPRLVGIISDDLTGANAVGAMFAARGLPACTVLGPDPSPGTLPDAGVLVVDTATRDASPAAAGEAARTAATWLRQLGARLIAKRIDTTLRGSIGAEVGATLAVLGEDTVAVVVPAAPEAGRTAVGGRVYLDGRPLAEILGGCDQMLALILDQVDGYAGAQIELATVRRGAGAVIDAIAAAAARGAHIVVCDAETPADMDALARGVAGCAFPVLPVDPGGFTLALADLTPRPPSLKGSRSGLFPLPSERGPGGRSGGEGNGGEVPLLAVFGSATSTAAAQVRFALTRGLVSLVTIDEGAVAAGGHRLAHEIERVVQATIARDRGMTGILVRATDARAGGAPVGRREVASTLAAVAAGVLKRDPRFGGVYLSGGDVARATLDRLGTRAILVDGEVLPLAALGRLTGGPHEGLRVVTKGGMVGGPDAIARCLAALRASVIARG